ncbi:MAG: hypothetical protein U0452_16435 [Anaerolineae bacterium]
MARKSSPTQDDELTALDDPFDGGALPDEPLTPPPPPSTGPTCGQFLGGCLEIILIVLIVVMACGLVTGTGVWLGKDRGLLPDEPPTAVPALLDSVPTVAPLNVPTLEAAPAAERTLEVVAVTPVGTPIPAGIVCADGAAWWFSQMDTFNSLAVALPASVTGAENPAALRLRLSPRRDALASAGAPACLEAPYAALLGAMDDTLAGLSAAEAGETAALDAHAEAITLALAHTLTSLWDLGVFTAPDAPTTRSIARGSGGDCSPEAWHAALAPVWANFTTEANAARTATALNLNMAIGRMNTLIEQAAALQAPGCVSEVGRLALAWMTATTDSFRAQVSNDAAARQTSAAQAAQTLILLRAWEDWLGLPAL